LLVFAYLRSELANNCASSPASDSVGSSISGSDGVGGSAGDSAGFGNCDGDYDGLRIDDPRLKCSLSAVGRTSGVGC